MHTHSISPPSPVAVLAPYLFGIFIYDLHVNVYISVCVCLYVMYIFTGIYIYVYTYTDTHVYEHTPACDMRWQRFVGCFLDCRVSLFQRALQLQGSFAKETWQCREPTPQEDY